MRIRRWKLYPAIEYPPHDLIREDGRLEKMCKHGIGHTVGHCEPKECKNRYTWVHGCDGCCEGYATMCPDKFDE